MIVDVSKKNNNELYEMIRSLAERVERLEDKIDYLQESTKKEAAGTWVTSW